jgi:hypothetical protein
MTVQGPHPDCTIITTRGHKLSIGTERNRTNPTVVATEDGLVKGGERLKIFWSWELRQQRVGVDVEPVLPDSRCKIKIQTAVKAFLDKLAVTGNLSERVELGRKILLFSFFGVLVLPGFLLLFGREIFRWRVITKIVSRRSKFGGWDVHDMRILWLLIRPHVIIRLLLLLLLSLAFLRGLVGQNTSLLDSTDKLGDSLCLVL